MALDPELKREIVNVLNANRQLIADDPAFAAFDEMFVEQPKGQNAITTMNMWRDYVELVLKYSPNKILFNLRREISSCLRVYGAVFNA